MKAVRFANVTLFTGGISCLVFLSYLVYQHGWAGHYLFLIAVAGALLVSLGLQPSMKINFTLLIISTVIASYTAELILAQASTTILASDWSPWIAWSRDELDSRSELERRLHGNFDSRNRLEVIQDLYREGIEAYPPIGAKLFLPAEPSHSLVSMIQIDGLPVLPLGGISNKVTVYCNENGQFTIYKSDEHGFHNPYGIWSNSAIDIGVIGDSFTHGACVPTDKNFVALIRHQYPVTLNLGMGASGPLIELATLSEYLIGMKPKLVLWVYYEGNDLKDLSTEKDNPLLMSYLTDTADQGLLNKQVVVDQALTGLVKRVMKDIEQDSSRANRRQVAERFIKLSHIREKLQLLKLPGLTQEATETKESEKASQETVELFRRVLQKAIKSVTAREGRVAFVYLPQWARYSNPSHASQDRERILELVRGLGIPVIDIHPAFAAQKDPLALFPFRLPGHYNEQGNRIVAEEVLRFIHASGETRGPLQAADRAQSTRPDFAWSLH